MLYDSCVITKNALKKRGIFLQIIATISIWSTLPAVLLVNISVWLYHQIYFSIYDIPKSRLRDYVSFDRQRLSRLNIFQKLGCMYCAYANGLAAWLKVITNRTELYSCAIKHKTPVLGHEHQKEFYAYQDFE